MNKEELNFRNCGFTDEAVNYPRSKNEIVAICAFNGIEPDQAPKEWCYAPNEVCQKSWQRVIEASQYDDATAHSIKCAYVNRCNVNNLSIEAWDLVLQALK